MSSAAGKYWLWYRHTGQAELPEGVDWTTLYEPTLQTREQVLKETHKQSVTHIKTAMTIPQLLTELAPEVRHLQYMSNGKYDTTAIANLINSRIPSLHSLTELILCRNRLGELPLTICDRVSLQTLNIASTGITTLPKELSKLTNLESLSISGNDMKANGLPEVVGELINLRSLSLSWCTVKLPDSLAKLTNLEILDMRDNAFGTLPAVVCSMTSLKELDLQSCLLKDLPASFSQLTNLENLSLRANPMSVLPKSVCQITSLKILNLGKCEFKKLPASIENLENLEELSADSNNFSEFGFPEDITKLTKLKTLNMNECHLPTLPDNFKDLQSLEVLYLGDKNFYNRVSLPHMISSIRNLRKLSFKRCQIKDHNFHNLVNMVDLGISDSKLSEENLAALSQLTQLESLTLKRCFLKTLPNSFKNLKKMKSLWLEGNSFECLPLVILSMVNLESLYMQNVKTLTQLDGGLLALTDMKYASFQGCTSLTSPPFSICSQGWLPIKQYYIDMNKGKGKNLPIAVVAVIGRKLAGKTSLVKTLQNSKAKKRVLTYRGPDEAKDEATKVFNVESVHTENTILRFIDVGGHDIYQLAYQLTLRKNCIPIIVINMEEFQRLSEDSEVGISESVRRLGFDWMSHMYIGCPNLGPPKLILTHRDKVSDEEFSSLRQLFLDTMNELKSDLILDESSVEAEFEQIAHLADADRPVVAVDDVYVVGNDYQTFGELLAALESNCMEFSQQIPDIWEIIGEILEQQKDGSITIEQLEKILSQKRLEVSRAQLEIILGYLHESGRILWYKNIIALQNHVFHKISAVTDLIGVLFHHTDELIWEQRRKKFKPFKSAEGTRIEKDYYEELVSDFQETGVMDQILLHRLIEQESQFKGDNLPLAISLLETFRLLHGPVSHRGAMSYIIPYFCRGFQNDSLLLDDQYLNLKAELKFGGLSLPRYVYHQMSLALLERFPDESDQAIVKQNGITVYHNNTNIQLTHDSNTRTVSIQVISDLASIEKTWHLFVEIINNSIYETLRHWKAARPLCVFYCPHCLMKGTQHPKRTINPSWCSTSPKYKKGKEITLVDGGEVTVCGQDRKVLKALMFPCKLSNEGMKNLEIYAADLHKARQQNSKKDVGDGDIQSKPPVSTHIPGIQKTSSVPQPLSSGGDDISIISDGYDYLVPATPELIDISFRPQRTTNKSIRQLYTNSDKIYKMTSPKRGRAVIINNMNFKGRDEARREGSDVDLRNINRLFYELGFETTKLQDLTAKELVDTVRAETEDPLHEDFGMFALVIMSHGTENDCFYGSDMKTVRLVDICELLAGSNFPAMEGKPKLLIIQACAGEKADFGGGGHHEEERAEPEPEANQQSAAGQQQQHGMNKSLNVDDLLIIKSSFETYSSIRNTAHGSLFIRALVATFLKHSAHRDVYSLHEIMQERVRRTSMELSRRYPAHNIGGQTVICIKTLTRLRKLYLFPLYDGPRSVFTKDRKQFIEVEDDMIGAQIPSGGNYDTDKMARQIDFGDMDDMFGEDGAEYSTDKICRLDMDQNPDEDDGMWAKDGVSCNRPKAKSTASQAKQSEVESDQRSCACNIQ